MSTSFKVKCQVPVMNSGCPVLWLQQGLWNGTGTSPKSSFATESPLAFPISESPFSQVRHEEVAFQLTGLWWDLNEMVWVGRAGQWWWCRPITLALRMQRQENSKLKASLGYIENGTELPSCEDDGLSKRHVLCCYFKFSIFFFHYHRLPADCSNAKMMFPIYPRRLLES